MTDAQKHEDNAIEAAALAREAADKAHRAQISEIVEEAIKPISKRLTDQDEKIAKLATKEDIDTKFQKISDFVDGFNLTVKVGGIVGKYGLKTITIVVTLIIAFGIISGGFKAALAGIAGWAISK